LLAPFVAADVPGGMFQRFFEHVDATPEQALAAIPARRLLPMSELATAVRFLLDPAALHGGYDARDGRRLHQPVSVVASSAVPVRPRANPRLRVRHAG